MTKIVELPKTHKPDEPDIEIHFGGCPHCGKTDGCMNYGRNHWYYCDEHTTRWCIGSNLFSSWREETEEDWYVTGQRLANHVEVMPISFKRDITPWPRPPAKQPRAKDFERWRREYRKEEANKPQDDDSDIPF